MIRNQDGTVSENNYDSQKERLFNSSGFRQKSSASEIEKSQSSQRIETQVKELVKVGRSQLESTNRAISALTEYLKEQKTSEVIEGTRNSLQATTKLMQEEKGNNATKSSDAEVAKVAETILTSTKHLAEYSKASAKLEGSIGRIEKFCQSMSSRLATKDQMEKFISAVTSGKISKGKDAARKMGFTGKDAEFASKVFDPAVSEIQKKAKERAKENAVSTKPSENAVVHSNATENALQTEGNTYEDKVRQQELDEELNETERESTETIGQIRDLLVEQFKKEVKKEVIVTSGKSSDKEEEKENKGGGGGFLDALTDLIPDKLKFNVMEKAGSALAKLFGGGGAKVAGEGAKSAGWLANSRVGQAVTNLVKNRIVPSKAGQLVGKAAGATGKAIKFAGNTMKYSGKALGVAANLYGAYEYGSSVSEHHDRMQQYRDLVAQGMDENEAAKMSFGDGWKGHGDYLQASLEAQLGIKGNAATDALYHTADMMRFGNKDFATNASNAFALYGTAKTAQYGMKGAKAAYQVGKAGFQAARAGGGLLRGGATAAKNLYKAGQIAKQVKNTKKLITAIKVGRAAWIAGKSIRMAASIGPQALVMLATEYAVEAAFTAAENGIANAEADNNWKDAMKKSNNLYQGIGNVGGENKKQIQSYFEKQRLGTGEVTSAEELAFMKYSVVALYSKMVDAAIAEYLKAFPPQNGFVRAFTGNQDHNDAKNELSNLTSQFAMAVRNLDSKEKVQELFMAYQNKLSETVKKLAVKANDSWYTSKEADQKAAAELDEKVRKAAFVAKYGKEFAESDQGKELYEYEQNLLNGNIETKTKGADATIDNSAVKGNALNFDAFQAYTGESIDQNTYDKMSGYKYRFVDKGNGIGELVRFKGSLEHPEQEEVVGKFTREQAAQILGVGSGGNSGFQGEMVDNGSQGNAQIGIQPRAASGVQVQQPQGNQTINNATNIVNTTADFTRAIDLSFNYA